jgi:hypothetical protein
MGGLLNDTVELQQGAREFTRWIILRMLYACRPGAASEKIILRVLKSLEFDCDLADVRDAINYMRLIGLAETEKNRTTAGRARLTPLGVAVVEHSTHAPSGIARPRRWRSAKR